MRIAIIHPDLGIGGAERLIVDAASELATHGHYVHVFTAHHDPSRCFEETLGGEFPVTVYGSFIPRHLFYLFHALCAYIRCIFVAMCVIFLWRPFDIILVDQVSVVVPLLKLNKSTKVVFYCHFPDLLLAQHNTFSRRVYRKIIDFVEEITTGKADMVFVNSKFTAAAFANTFKHLHSHGIRPSVLYPAVNLSHFDQPPPFFSSTTFLSINRFERKKNVELAISALSLMHRVGPQNDSSLRNVTLVLAGGFDKRLRENTEYLEELKAVAEQEGVSGRVSFVTSCSTPRRNALLSECLCVLYTPKDEHFGIVPLEAMAAGKPVIACRSGGPMETVKDGETGFLCDPTPEEFGLAMARLVRDPNMARVMGRRARDHVHSSFSTRVFGHRLNTHLLNLCPLHKEDRTE